MFSQISDRARECESILGRLPIKGRDGIATDKEALLNSKYNEANATCARRSVIRRGEVQRDHVHGYRAGQMCRSGAPCWRISPLRGGV
jgi:DNA-binding transcriptional regulator YbjK